MTGTTCPKCRKTGVNTMLKDIGKQNLWCDVHQEGFYWIPRRLVPMKRQIPETAHTSA